MSLNMNANVPDYAARRRAVAKVLKPLAVVGGLGVVALFVAVAVAQQDDEAPSTQPAQVAPKAEPFDGDLSDFADAGEGVMVRTTAEPGDPPVAADGDVVMVHYTGQLEDGTVFDTSRQVRQGKRFPEPIMLQLGRGQVIAGWEIGLRGMRVGERRRLVIPPEQAYGASGAGGTIPPNATLIFDVELVGVSKPE